MKRLSSFSLAVLALAASCASNPFNNDPESIDTALLQFADEAGQESVRSAEMDVLDAQNALATAELAVTEAEENRRIAQQQAEVAEERVDVAEARRAASEKSAVIEASTDYVDEAAKNLETARARITLHDRTIDARKQAVIVAEEELAVAEARAELAKARAVEDIDREEAGKVDVASYEARVRKAESDLEVAKVRHEACDKELEAAQEAIDANMARPLRK